MIRRAYTATILLVILTGLVAAQVRVGSVSGRIQAQDGTPAARIRVAAVATGDVDALQAKTLVTSTLTDDAGRYRLEDIPPGRYLIAAGPIGTLTYWPGTPVESKATAIAIAAGPPTENLNFKLMEPPGVRLSGVVTGLPLNPSAQTLRAYRVVLIGAALLSRGTQMTMQSPLKDDGTFELPGVPPGSYQIQVFPGSQRTRLTVKDSNIDNITFDASPVVTGRVTFEDGSPVPTTTMIIAIPSDGGGFTTYSVANDGTFSFAAAPGISYGVLAYALPFGSWLKALRSGSTDLRTARLSIDAGVAVKEVEVVLTKQRPADEPEGVTVRGRVNLNGQSFPAELDLELTMSPTRYYHLTRIAGDGTFSVSNVPPGKYMARLSIGGVALIPEGTYGVGLTRNAPLFALKSVMYGSADATQGITIDPSKPPEDLVITLRHRESP